MRTLHTAKAIGNAIGKDQQSVFVCVCFIEENDIVLENVELFKDGIVGYDEKTVKEIKKKIKNDRFYKPVRLKWLFT
ncbi:hypothetical protein CN504_22775 [Bacillus anthracis]|nr:hypothetical protein CN504_22775 [Bacillus anthracis]